MFSAIVRVLIFGDFFLLLQLFLGGELPTQMVKAPVLKFPSSGQPLSRCLKLLGFPDQKQLSQNCRPGEVTGFYINKTYIWSLGGFLTPGELGYLVCTHNPVCPGVWLQNEVSDIGKMSKNDQSQGLLEPKNVNRGTRVTCINKRNQLP